MAERPVRYTKRRETTKLEPRPDIIIDGCAPGVDRGLVSLFREAIGGHYDIEVVMIAEEYADGTPILNADDSPRCREYLIVVYDKDGTVPRLTLLVAG